MRSEAPPRSSRAAALAARVRLVTASEWVVLAESAVLAVGIEAGLRLLPLARVLEAVHGREGGARVPHVDRAVQERLARLARWPFKMLPLPSTCLRIAL